MLGSGLLRGVLIGVVMSLLLLLRRASRPRTTELGRVPGTGLLRRRGRNPENERFPDVFVFRAEAALLYFNVDHVRDRFFELLDARGEGIRLAVFFLGTSPGVDLAGAELLEELHHALRERGIAFRLAEARGDVRETLRRAGFEQHCGPVAAEPAGGDGHRGVASRGLKVSSHRRPGGPQLRDGLLDPLRHGRLGEGQVGARVVGLLVADLAVHLEDAVVAAGRSGRRRPG